MNFIYEIENLKCFYKDKLALDIKNLRIEQGSMTALSGPNGSGKSTLLRVLAFLQPFEGIMKFFGKENPNKFERRKATLLLQNSFLLKRSVFENVAYGLRVRKIPNDEITTRVEEALLKVGLAPQNFSGRPWYALSGGEAQRVGLAARLAISPDVLLLDEPTASIDSASVEAITKVLEDERRNGTTIVIASHDSEWLNSLTFDKSLLLQNP